MFHAMVEAPNGKLIDIDSCGTPQKWKEILNNIGDGPFAILKASAKDMGDLPIENPKSNVPIQIVKLAREYAEIRMRNATK
jgi:hypothetical protein